MDWIVEYMKRVAAERKLKIYRWWLACALVVIAYFFGKTRRM